MIRVKEDKHILRRMIGMFRLANDLFKEEKELYELATSIVTETIVDHLAFYFEEGWESASHNQLYQKVNQGKVKNLIPRKLSLEIERLGINQEQFVAKKVAQMMSQLKAEEGHTFDVFNEYLLAQMIETQRNQGWDYTLGYVKELLPELRKSIREYAKSYLDFEDVKERNRFVRQSINSLTKFHTFLDMDDYLEANCVFWDADYTYIDDWGLDGFVWACLRGIMDCRGYGIEYIRDVFHSVGEPFPLTILKTKKSF